MFTKSSLLEARRSALRRRIWFSALDNTERGILSISSKIIDTVKSDILNSLLVKIILKLKNALEIGFIRYFENFGLKRMRIIQGQAYLFGYIHAGELSRDVGFVEYLAFLDYNQPTGWRA
jgi:hypothetical protein